MAAAETAFRAAIEVDPEISIAYFNRALLREHRAKLAQGAMRGLLAQREREWARADANEAIRRSQMPREPRIEALARELAPVESR